MKIKNIFETEEINQENVLVSLDSKVFNGLIRSNTTAYFIIDCLKEETTEETIVEKMMGKYNISRETALNGVGKIVSQLRELNLLEE